MCLPRDGTTTMRRAWCVTAVFLYVVALADALVVDVYTKWPARVAPKGYFAELPSVLSDVTAFYKRSGVDVTFRIQKGLRPFACPGLQDPRRTAFSDQINENHRILAVLPPCPKLPAQGSTTGNAAWVQRLPGSSRSDFARVVAHEIGHMMGLLHGNDPNSIMGPWTGTFKTATLEAWERWKLGRPTGSLPTCNGTFIVEDVVGEIKGCSIRLWIGNNVVSSSSRVEFASCCATAGSSQLLK